MGKFILQAAGETIGKQYLIIKLVHNRHSLSAFYR